MYIVEDEQNTLKSRSGYIIKTMVMNKTHEKNFPVKSKMIAVWGSPHSGKTLFSVKLASTIYEQYKSTVIVLHADMETTSIPVIFPNCKSSELFSVGAALSGTDVTQDEVIKNMITVKGKANFGFLGYLDGENKYSYPKCGEPKIRALFAVLKGLADYVIVDCTSNLSNVISKVAIIDADEIIRFAVPDLKSISYYASQMPLYTEPCYRFEQHIQALNIPDAELYIPIEDAKQHFRDVRFTIPHCREVKQQMMDGRLLDNINDKKFNGKFKAVVERLV